MGLTVLYYDNPPDEMRGKTRRYLYEIRPNMFTGRISARVRDELWNLISGNGVSATLICSADNEQGFDVRTTSSGEDRCGFIDMDGILLPYRRKTFLGVYDVYAKPCKSLLDHMLEAGSVAEAILRCGSLSEFIMKTAEKHGVNADSLINSICFICAVHDIGKCHPSFLWNLVRSCEGKPDGLSEFSETFGNLMISLGIEEEHAEIRHERYSRQILVEWFERHMPEGITSLEKSRFRNLCCDIVFHHQGKKGNASDVYASLSGKWTELQDLLIDVIRRRWPFDKEILTINKNLSGLHFMILSVMMTADWIVSGEEWNGFLERNSDTGSLYDIAVKFLKENHMFHIPIEKRFPELTWEKVFPFTKNTMQEAAVETAKTMAELLLIEGPCHNGKTEASLAAGYIMGREKGGIFYALPTISTTGAMVKRIRSLIEKLGLDEDLYIPEMDGDAFWSDDEDNLSVRSLWSGKIRHQMHYPFSVGTIDQLLKCVCAYRYSCIGMSGLADKVVIIDEIHSYDAYMLTEIRMLLSWCRYLGVPVIMLSATLSDTMKKRLFEGYRIPETGFSQAYPLVTAAKDGKITEYPVEMRGEKKQVDVVNTDNYLEDMTEDAVKLREGCLCSIAGTVDDAILLDTMVRETGITGPETSLYHARMTQAQKEKISADLLRSFGKDRSFRPKKSVTNCTSIIGVSLDIDYDFMNSVICPVDDYIQRRGREQRHDDAGTIREHTHIGSLGKVYVPTEKDFGSLKNIYDVEILKRTAEVLEKHSTFDTVADVRAMINEVYREDAINSKAILSEQNAYGNILSSPYKREPCNTDLTVYDRYNARSPVTREESYPTSTVGIITQEEADNLDDFDTAKRIRREKTVNVGDYKLKKIGKGRFLDGLLPDTEFYISENGEYAGEGRKMKLTDQGLIFGDNDD